MKNRQRVSSWWRCCAVLLGLLAFAQSQTWVQESLIVMFSCWLSAIGD